MAFYSVVSWLVPEACPKVVEGRPVGTWLVDLHIPCSQMNLSCWSVTYSRVLMSQLSSADATFP